MAADCPGYLSHITIINLSETDILPDFSGIWFHITMQTIVVKALGGSRNLHISPDRFGETIYAVALYLRFASVRAPQRSILDI